MAYDFKYLKMISSLIQKLLSLRKLHHEIIMAHAKIFERQDTTLNYFDQKEEAISRLRDEQCYRHCQFLTWYRRSAFYTNELQVHKYTQLSFPKTFINIKKRNDQVYFKEINHNQGWKIRGKVINDLERAIFRKWWDLPCITAIKLLYINLESMTVTSQSWPLSWYKALPKSL